MVEGKQALGRGNRQAGPGWRGGPALLLAWTRADRALRAAEALAGGVRRAGRRREAGPSWDGPRERMGRVEVFLLLGFLSISYSFLLQTHTN